MHFDVFIHLVFLLIAGMFKVLFWSFEAWLIWVNLLLILIFAELGVYYSGAVASAEHTLLNNLTVVLGGFFVTTFDAFKVDTLFQSSAIHRLCCSFSSLFLLDLLWASCFITLLFICSAQNSHGVCTRQF
jgi:hypothetical protein